MFYPILPVVELGLTRAETSCKNRAKIFPIHRTKLKTCCPMKYHDTGAKNPDHALARWFEQVLDENVTELRIQSGYFRLDAVRAIAPSLKKAADLNLPTIFVIGSNDGDTTHLELCQLMTRMGIPRANAKLGVVSFGNFLFHPKVYHITRKNGSQAAFVGSANFTSPGVTGGNVEAAVSLDSAGTEEERVVLNEIARAVDRWFTLPTPEGVSIVQSLADLDALLAAGILSSTRPPRIPRTGAAGPLSMGGGQPTRKKLIVLPPWPDEPELPTDAVDGDSDAEGDNASKTPKPSPATPTSSSAPPLVSSSQVGFPSYFIFASGTTAPTSGAEAMSGAPLANGAVGLLLKLNKDNARHFSGGVGTANISIPTATVGTFIFGVFGVHKRPRVELTMNIRYVADSLVIDGGLAASNVMGYGFAPKESGHADIRMLMPAAVKGIASEAKIQGQPFPTENDLVLLEWPTPDTLSFGLTFLSKASVLSVKAHALYSAAEAKGELVGGACWLPAGFSPAW